jgi:hypothetical protein
MDEREHRIPPDARSPLEHPSHRSAAVSDVFS